VNFSHVLHAAIGLLVVEGRLSYRRLKVEFELDDRQLEALRFELTEVKHLAVDCAGEWLAWAPDGAAIARTSDRPARQLPEASPAIEPPGLASAVSDAERRPLTVMFCDLADSTSLSARLDPEDLQDVIRAYQEHCTGIVRAYEGFVAKYMGDGILVTSYP
jgi:class 3 adenylate cyclase